MAQSPPWLTPNKDQTRLGVRQGPFAPRESLPFDGFTGRGGQAPLSISTAPVRTYEGTPFQNLPPTAQQFAAVGVYPHFDNSPASFIQPSPEPPPLRFDVRPNLESPETAPETSPAYDPAPENGTMVAAPGPTQVNPQRPQAYAPPAMQPQADADLALLVAALGGDEPMFIPQVPQRVAQNTQREEPIVEDSAFEPRTTKPRVRQNSKA